MKLMYVTLYVMNRFLINHVTSQNYLPLLFINDTIKERPHNGKTKVIIIIISIISPRAYLFKVSPFYYDRYVSRSIINYNSQDNVMQQQSPEQCPLLNVVAFVVFPDRRRQGHLFPE